ncbi:copper-binding metallochaperone CopP [Helicobacter ailurogastricus]|uniref:COP associated protein n=1 Tax=Helicobacter ailurogastricus TaxID=1578720 RepID=A0A0K2X8Y0_9HELI|nr:copper-binding metallochaperone CopP [Helicobacter ailurogastricus]CRF40406.1 COP associated protein [Helicobacter ailurogastricus]CRF42531.1 COP associated protein [Helicobacter ailurogastricus]CRF44521.1 COP associated protein [Helicobacter ailurogastricus]
MQEVLKVSGMTCDHCVDKIEKFIGELEGIEHIEVNLNKQEVAVTFNPPATLADIKEAILDAGYTLA